MPSTTEPHQIRLRGPWQVAWLGNEPRTQEKLTFDTVHLPESWNELFGTAAGRAVFQRRFNRPTNLDPDERVYILLTDVPGNVVLRLNQVKIALAGSTPPRCDYNVTDALRDFNLLEIEIVCDPTAQSERAAGLWQPVLLEIRNELPD